MDPAAVGALEIGPYVDDNQGSEYIMGSVGELPILGSNLAVGLKIPRSTSVNPENKIYQELVAVSMLLKYMPELSSHVPRFMGLLAIEGDKDPTAILTEDASQGGRVGVRPLGNLSVFGHLDITDSIVRAFADVQGATVKPSYIDQTACFMAGDELKLLDFTPPPVFFSEEGMDESIKDKACDMTYEPELMVRIDAKSPLALSLTAS